MNFRTKTILSLVFLALIIFFFKPGSSPNFWLVIFAFFQSALLYFFIEEKPRTNLFRKIVLVAIPVFVVVFIMGSGIYKDTFKVTNFEKNVLWEREELYRRELGFIGRNNTGNKFIEQTKLVVDKVNQKITEPYEISHYFSSENYAFYSLIFFPFFALGFLVMLSEKIKPTLYYLGLATIGAILVPPDMAYWLFIPLINLGLLMGIKNIKRLFKH
jgi:hypothetical protein